MGKRGGHGRRAKRIGRKDEGWKRDLSEWNEKYLAAFWKARKKTGAEDKMLREEQQMVALLVGAKAENLHIRPDRAGNLAAQLCEDFENARVRLMKDLINNPGILESVKKVMAQEGDEGDVGEEKDRKEVEEAEEAEAAEASHT